MVLGWETILIKQQWATSNFILSFLRILGFQENAYKIRNLGKYMENIIF